MRFEAGHLCPLTYDLYCRGAELHTRELLYNRRATPFSQHRGRGAPDLGRYAYSGDRHAPVRANRVLGLDFTYLSFVVHGEWV